MQIDFMTALTCILIPVAIIGTIYFCAPRGGRGGEKVKTLAVLYGPGFVDVECDAAGQRKLVQHLGGTNVKSMVHTGTHKVRLELASRNIEVARTIHDTINAAEEYLL